VANQFVAILLAGGSGKRFWPLSREARPKQFLRLLGTSTLIEETCDRVRLADGTPPPVIVSAHRQQALVRESLGDRAFTLVTEPCGRNTGPAVALGLIHALRTTPDAIVGVFASDHYIPDTADFHRHLRAAIRFARDTDRIVTLGLVPTLPETGYGYIQRAPQVLSRAEGLACHDVAAFVEKPDLATAQRYLAEGSYLWNSGMFVARASRLLAELYACLPEVAAAADELATLLGTPAYEPRLLEVFPTLPSVSIDVGVLEKTRAIAVLPAAFAWSDVGSWNALLPFADAEQECFVRGERVYLHDCRRTLVVRDGEHTSVLAACGLDGVGVIETADATLVLSLDRAQEVRRILEAIEARGEHRDVL
jgi:mannose-1-phosphate guanylyltransferase/mannose-6-phosphate isomerase